MNKLLTKKQKSQIESLLLKQKDEFKALESKSALTPDKRFKPSEDRHNNLDERKSDVILSRELYLENHYLKELQKIGRALDKINGSQFGICLDCRSPIGFDRLFAFPMAERCIDCKLSYEKRYPSNVKESNKQS